MFFFRVLINVYLFSLYTQSNNNKMAAYETYVALVHHCSITVVCLDNITRSFSTIRWEFSYYIVHHDLRKNSHAYTHPPYSSKTTAKSYAILAISSSERHLHMCIHKSMHTFHKILFHVREKNGGGKKCLSLIRHFVTSEFAHCISIILFVYIFYLQDIKTHVCNVFVAMSILKSEILFFMVISFPFSHLPPIPMVFEVKTLNIWTQ